MFFFVNINHPRYKPYKKTKNEKKKLKHRVHVECIYYLLLTIRHENNHFGKQKLKQETSRRKIF